MKYRDVIVFFLAIAFILSLGFAIGVDTRFWFLPVLLFVLLIVFYYWLWIKR